MNDKTVVQVYIYKWYINVYICLIRSFFSEIYYILFIISNHSFAEHSRAKLGWIEMGVRPRGQY